MRRSDGNWLAVWGTQGSGIGVEVAGGGRGGRGGRATFWTWTGGAGGQGQSGRRLMVPCVCHLRHDVACWWLRALRPSGASVARPPTSGREPVCPEVQYTVVQQGTRPLSSISPYSCSGMTPRTSKEGMMKMAQNPACVGIDVSQAELVVCLNTGSDCLKVVNSAAGWAELLVVLMKRESVLVVLEATGGYERGVAEFLRGGGVRVWVVDPRRVRQFARAGGRRAKTDPIDARMIAHFGATYCADCPEAPATGEERRRLKEYVACRRVTVHSPPVDQAVAGMAL